ncbi:MAG TPA: FtsX-like permease family protein [Beutenbergiaceae bacterium]|nr:FtsX-like permease family protein [Beutenbergiaceae bacterium]
MNLTARRVLSESLQTLRGSRPVTIALTALIALATAAVILTAGRAASLERDVLASVDDAGPRLITIHSQETNGGLQADVVQRIAGLHGVEWVIGLTPATDARNAHIPGARAVSTRTIVGDWPPPIRPETLPPPGAALVTETAQVLLGLRAPAGAITSTTYGGVTPVVGHFRASPPLEELDRVILLTEDPDQPSAVVSTIRLLAEHAADVPNLADAVVELSGAEHRTQIVVETSATLVDLQHVVSGQLSQFSRRLAAAIVAGSAVIISLVLMMISVTRRRDFGRRRALGATRRDIAALVPAGALVPAAAGALLGVTVGNAALLTTPQSVPPPTFSAASGILTVLAAGLASLPAAVHTARRDPASVLRVP